MKIPLLVGLCLGGMAVAAAAAPTEWEEEDLKQLVVMIDATIAGEAAYGAGFIVGAGPDSLYIATANHVVRSAEVGADTIQVRFRWSPTQPRTATLMRQYDASLDLAVLRVSGLQQIGVSLASLPFERTRRPESLRRRDGLYLLGYPLRRGWRMNTAPEPLAERNGELLEFESNFVARGHSGGLLLDDDLNVVGMLKSDTPPYGQAVDIATIVKRLRQFDVPVRLGVRSVPDTFATLSAASGRICGLTALGAAYCWGSVGSADDNLRGGIRTFSERPARVRGGLRFRSLSTSNQHTCGLVADGTAYCWGANSEGELGSSSVDDDGSLTPVAVAGNHTFKVLSTDGLRTCGVRNDGTVYCWGRALGSVRGYGTKTPEAMGGTERFEVVGVSSGEVLLAIGAGGEVFTRTRSDKWVPAPGGIRLRSLGRNCGVTAAGEAMCWGAVKGDDYLGLYKTPGGLRFRSVSDYNGGACGVAESEDVYCWRYPIGYTLADWKPADPVRVTTALRFSFVATGRDAACGLVKDSGGVYCWGKVSSTYNTPGSQTHITYGERPWPVAQDVWESGREIEAARTEHDYRRAFSLAEAALKRYPRDRSLRRLHALTLSDAGRTADAVAELRSILADESYLNASWTLATVYKRARDYANMDAAFEAAEKQATTDEDKFNLAWDRAEGNSRDPKRFDKAEAGYRDLLRRQPDNASVLNSFGYALVDRADRLREAESLLTRAVALDPGNGFILDSLGVVYLRTGRLEQAEALLVRAWRQTGDGEAVIAEHLGDLYFRQGKRELALARWRDAEAAFNRAAPIDVDAEALARVRTSIASAGK